MSKFLSTGHNYQFVPAGLSSDDVGGLAIYIKYKSQLSNSITLTKSQPTCMEFDCPDRKLLFVTDANMAYSDLHFDFDEVVNCSPMWETQPNLPAFMINVTEYLRRPDIITNARKKEGDRNNLIFCDSGGFQLQSGVIDYINPKSLIQFYNDNTDLGVVLDIPHVRWQWDGLLELAANAQKASTDVMMKYKKESLSLINVVHGINMDMYHRYHDIIFNKDIDRLCVGGIYHTSLFKSINNTLQLIDSYGDHYKHFHFLGIARLQQMYSFMRIASKEGAPFITSDSSTWLQKSLHMEYFNWVTTHGVPNFRYIGRDANKPNAHKILNCSCPVCSAVKYQDIFSTYQQRVRPFLGMHNQFAFESFSKSMYNIIKDADLQDLKDLVKSQFSTRTSSLEETLHCLDMVDHYYDNGMESTNKRFSLYLNSFDAKATKTKLLFSEEVEVTEVEEEGLIHLEEDHPIRTRLERIMNGYIRNADHEVEKSIKKTKKEKGTRKGHPGHLSSVAVKRGKKKIKRGKHEGQENI